MWKSEAALESEILKAKKNIKKRDNFDRNNKKKKELWDMSQSVNAGKFQDRWRGDWTQMKSGSTNDSENTMDWIRE